MRRNLLFLSFLAATLFSGCSNDENSVIGEESKNYGYVAVNIVQSTSAGTRATTEADFEKGTEAENTATKGLFFIIDNEGNVTSAQEIELSGNTNGTTINPAVERIYNAVLVIKNEDSRPNVKEIVCVLNAPKELEGIKTLGKLKETISNYETEGKSGTFVMSNSVYKDGNNTIVGAVVTPDKIASTAELAQANPVEIFVERVVAKVRAKVDNFTSEGASVTIDGATEKKELTINVTGIEVANIAQQSYLLKDISNFESDWSWVNDADNKRSYWEKTAATRQNEFSNKSYKNIAKDNFDITQLTGDNKYEEYIQPNTNEDIKTSILVTAQLMDGEKPVDLAYIVGGYTTKEGALNIIANYLTSKGYYGKVTKDQNNSETVISREALEAKDFEWSDDIDWLKSYEVVAQVKANTTIYDKEGNEVTDGVKSINDLLKTEITGKPYRARVFIEGKCYYFVNIDQSSVAEANAGTYEGVVRNHIYELTLQSIKGIGVPVFDPTKEIIPERPSDDDTFFLAAQVKVLRWRVVKQNIKFEGD